METKILTPIILQARVEVAPEEVLKSTRCNCSSKFFLFLAVQFTLEIFLYLWMESLYTSQIHFILMYLILMYCIVLFLGLPKQFKNCYNYQLHKVNHWLAVVTTIEYGLQNFEIFRITFA